MFYPEDFKDRVKKAYPDSDELHRRLDNGDDCVGRYLYDSSYPASISIDTILAAASLEELQKKAKAIKVKLDLYAEWVKLENKQSHSLMDKTVAHMYICVQLSIYLTYIL